MPGWKMRPPKPGTSALWLYMKIFKRVNNIINALGMRVEIVKPV